MSTTDGIRCMMMRGGTSKGLYFLAADLPPQPEQRDELPGAAGAELAEWPPPGQPLDVEHPTGHLLVEAELDTAQQPPQVQTAGVVRTARKLFDGIVFASSQP